MTREQDRPRARQDDRTAERMTPSRMDILTLAIACVLPTEARLETMLDRIEALK